MTEREKIIQSAVEIGIAIQDDNLAAICEPPTWNQMEAFYHKVQREILERAAKVADANCEDEPYGHAKFRCVNIADEIRQLIKE